MDQQLAMNACQAGRCAELVDRGAVLCDRHLAALHDDVRRELLDSYRPGRGPTRRYLVALERARRQVEFYEHTGVREPIDDGLPF